MREMLQENARLHLSISQAFFLKRFAPSFWDAPSCAEILHEAASGFPSSKKFSSAGRAALAAFESARRLCPSFPKGVQSAMYDAILGVLYIEIPFPVSY